MITCRGVATAKARLAAASSPAAHTTSVPLITPTLPAAWAGAVLSCHGSADLLGGEAGWLAPGLGSPEAGSVLVGVALLPPPPPHPASSREAAATTTRTRTC